MKKVIVLLAIALASTAAQAQQYYGGGYYHRDDGAVQGALVVGSLAGLFAASSTMQANSGCYNCNYDQVVATKTVNDIQEFRISGTMDPDLAQKLTDAKKITNADDATTMDLLNQTATAILQGKLTATEQQQVK